MTRKEDGEDATVKHRGVKNIPILIHNLYKIINNGHVHNGHAYATLTYPYIFVASFLFLKYAIFSLFLKTESDVWAM